jgi:hypothetical protein
VDEVHSGTVEGKDYPNLEMLDISTKTSGEIGQRDDET